MVDIAAPPLARYETAARTHPVGGPVRVAWREGTLTRARELEALCAWMTPHFGRQDGPLVAAIRCHLDAARDAAWARPPEPRKRLRMFRQGALIERATSNLDAAEALLLNVAPSAYVLGQMPSLLRHVQRHLNAADPGRQEFERIARCVGINDPVHPSSQNRTDQDWAGNRKTVDIERGKIVATVRAASSEALREHARLRSFRNVVAITTFLMTMLAIGVAITGMVKPTLVPMCFAPAQDNGRVVVVCPTGQSEPFFPEQTSQPSRGGLWSADEVGVEDIDDVVARTAKPEDLIVIELVGLTAAAIAAAAAIKGIRGTSERYALPVALAVLKLPTGALTAFLGLLLMRGQFVPGLNALDTPAQIMAWALVFGYAQQLFTRLVDQQGQTVLNSVRTVDKPATGRHPA